MQTRKDSKLRLYSMRARRWTREIALAAVLTLLALAYLGASFFSSAATGPVASSVGGQQGGPHRR
jgi:hypothetical protein